MKFPFLFLAAFVGSFQLNAQAPASAEPEFLTQIRQLTFECGYATASLRERIYSRTPQQGGEPEAGMLIYTAAGDTEGTNLMGILSWIVVGAIAGWLASQIMGSHEGLIMMVVLGIVGGLVGGWVALSVLKIGTVDGINFESILIATLGAIAVILVVNFARGSRGMGRG